MPEVNDKKFPYTKKGKAAARKEAATGKAAKKLLKYAPPEWKHMSKEERAKTHKEEAENEDFFIKTGKEGLKELKEKKSSLRKKGVKQDDYQKHLDTSSKYHNRKYISEAKHSRKVRTGKYKSNPPRMEDGWNSHDGLTTYEKGGQVRLKDFERNQSGITAMKALKRLIRKGKVTPEMSDDKIHKIIKRTKGLMKYTGKNTAGRIVSREDMPDDIDDKQDDFWVFMNAIDDEMGHEEGRHKKVRGQKAKANAARNIIAVKAKDTTPQKGRAPVE